MPEPIHCGDQEKLTSIPLPPIGTQQKIGPVRLLILQGTPFCNINCRYCYLPDRGNKGQMAIETVAATIDNLLASDLVEGPLLVNWHAGEPLVLSADFYRTRMPPFGRLESAGIPVTHSLQTNAMLVSDSHCEMFKEFDVKVGVSIDGPADIHDSQRQMRDGQGSHKRALAGIARLQEHGIQFNAICVLSDLSVRHPDRIYSFFKQLGVRAVGFNIEEIEGINKHSSITSPGFDDRYRQFLERLWELVETDRGLIRIREFDDAEGRILDTHPRRNSQTEPFINLTVACNGDFSTFSPELLGNHSSRHSDFIFGNVHTSLLRDSLRTDKFRRIREEIDEGVAACRAQCDYFEVCGGGNPSNKIAENDSFATTETSNCRNRIKTTCGVVISKIEDRARRVSNAGTAESSIGDIR
jgi:uncharacterized protein